MKEGEFVNDYFAQTLTISNKMKANDENKGDVVVVVVVEKILRSVTPKFDYVLDVAITYAGKNGYFSTLDENYKDSVKMGNNSNTTVADKGNILIHIMATLILLLTSFLC